METATITKPRLAFVGVGWIGRNRLKAVADSGLAVIAGISDTSADCIIETGKLVTAERIFDSFEEAAEQENIDAIVIATPSALHMAQATDALKKGKAVFCQKPLGRNSTEVRKMIGVAQEADRLLGADFSYRYTAAFRKIKEVIRSGELGEIFAVELKFHNAYGPGKPWFYDINLAGGGCVLDLGVHMIDMMLLAFDYPNVKNVNSSLYSKGKPLKGRNAVEDYADVTMELDNNVQAHLSCSWNLHAGREAEIEASFYGTNGGVSLKNVDGSFYDFETYLYRGTCAEVLVSGKDEWGGRAITDWVRKLSASRKFREEAYHYLPSAIVIDMIYGIDQ